MADLKTDLLKLSESVVNALTPGMEVPNVSELTRVTEATQTNPGYTRQPDILQSVSGPGPLSASNSYPKG
jgi:hypothetical protein